jgi:hypothetical protein
MNRQTVSLVIIDRILSEQNYPRYIHRLRLTLVLSQYREY